MRVRNLALACVAAVAMVLPARADVILTYHLSSFVPSNTSDTFPPGTQIPSGDVLGPQLLTTPGTPLVFMPGETKFIQVAIQANANPPTVVNGQNQDNWTIADDGNTLTTFGFGFNYPLSLVINPFTTPVAPLLNQNNPNARSQSGPQPPGGGATGYAFATSHPITYTNYNMGGTAIGGLDTNVGLGRAPGATALLPSTILAVLKVRAGMNPGTGTITMTDLNTAPTAAGFGLLDGTNLDDIIFAPAHNNFPLHIEVAVIPEPSSMCLAGLAIGGLAWRKLRRKKVAVAA